MGSTIDLMRERIEELETKVQAQQKKKTCQLMEVFMTRKTKVGLQETKEKPLTNMFRFVKFQTREKQMAWELVC